MFDDDMMKKEDLLERLENQSKVFQNPAVKAAFQAIDRKDFVLPDYDVEAYEDYALPTLEGQSIPQPTIVAFMLETLDARKGDTVLDIGSGSGWMSTLLGHMVGEEGKVIGLEILPSLVEQGQKNTAKYKNLPIEIKRADAEAGYYRNAPYDRIIASAEFESKETAPMELILQLAPGGIMVVPIAGSLFKFEKFGDDEIEETEYPGFSFVPYIES